jgi:hypothetical protein
LAGLCHARRRLRPRRRKLTAFIALGRRDPDGVRVDKLELKAGSLKQLAQGIGGRINADQRL